MIRAMLTNHLYSTKWQDNRFEISLLQWKFENENQSQNEKHIMNLASLNKSIMQDAEILKK